MSLIPRVASPSLDARLTLTMHRLHKVLKGGLRDGVPLDLKPSQGSLRGVVGLEPLFQNVSEMFDRVEVGRAGRPDHPVDVLLPEEVGDESGAMRRRIIVLVHGPWAQRLDSRDCNGAQNLVHVSCPVQISVDSMENSPRTKAHASPNHDRPSTVPVMFLYGGVLEPLPASPPHTIPAVMK